MFQHRLAQRWLVIMSSIVVLAQLFRPADWPLGPGWNLNEEVRQRANQVLYPIVAAALAVVLEGLSVLVVRFRPATPQPLRPKPTSAVWLGLVAAAVACLVVDLLWPTRRLSPAHAGIIPLELSLAGASIPLLLLWPYVRSRCESILPTSWILVPPRPQR